MRGDRIVCPCEPDRAMPPGAQEGNPILFDGSKGIAGIRTDGALADNHEPGFCPLVEPLRVCGSAAVVRGQEDIGRRLGRRTLDQLVETELLEITRQEEMAPDDRRRRARGFVRCQRFRGASHRAGARP